MFDFVLIDGDHSYTGALRDAEGILPFVADGAYVLFHDSYFYEVTQAIDDFVNRHVEVVDCGALTRETTIEKTKNNQTVYWGGLRMVQIRKR